MALEPLHSHFYCQNQRHACSTNSNTSIEATFLLATLNLLRSSLDSATSIDLGSPIPIGWERCLDLKTGKIFYRRVKMSRNNGKSPKLDLKLNLSQPVRGNSSGRVANDDDNNNSPNRSSSTSPPSSCVSSEAANSPEATSMVLAGCPRCLMYVMLTEEDPKCPKCKSTVLLDFLNNNTTTNKNNTKKTRKS